MRLSSSIAGIVGLVSTFSGCADQVQTGCPPITGNNGVIAVYMRQPQGTYAVFISCAGQQYELLTNYSFQSCPTPTDQAALRTVIDTMCAGVTSTSSTGVPTVPTTWTYSTSVAPTSTQSGSSTTDYSSSSTSSGSSTSSSQTTTESTTSESSTSTTTTSSSSETTTESTTTTGTTTTSSDTVTTTLVVG